MQTWCYCAKQLDSLWIIFLENWISNVSWIFTLLSAILVTCAKNVILTCLIVNITDIKQNICIYFSQSRGLVSWHWQPLGMIFLYQEQSRNSAVTACCFAIMLYFLFPPIRGNGIQQLPCHLQTFQGLVMLSFMWVPGTQSILRLTPFTNSRFPHNC